MKTGTLILTLLAGLAILGTTLYLNHTDRFKTRPEKPQTASHPQTHQERAVPGSNGAQNRETAPKTRPEKPQAQNREPAPKPKKPQPQNRETAWGNAPDISITTLDGKSLKLSDFKGKLIVLNFWVEGCGYCRIQMADLNRIHTESKDMEITVLGVNLDGYGLPRLKTFSENKKLLYPVATGERYEAAGRYGIRGFPTTFIIDRKGNVMHRYIGYTSYEIFAAALQKSGAR